MEVFSYFCTAIHSERMAQKLIATQQQTQTLTLTPQQLLLMKLLELSVPDMEQRVQNELEENVALEEGKDDATAQNDTTERTEEDFSDETDESLLRSRAETELDNYSSNDDAPDYLLRQVEAEREQRDVAMGGQESFYDELLRQVGEYSLSDEERYVLEYLIGSLDDDGLLRKPLDTIATELYVYNNLRVTEADVEAALKILQGFEPRGIGARSLQECLLLQLQAAEYHSPYRDEEMQVVEKYFDEFTHKRWHVIQQRLKASDETMVHIKHNLTRLNPRPGFALSDGLMQGAATIIPDFIIESEGESEPIIRLNTGHIPELRVSETFRDTLQAYSKGAKLSKEQRDTLQYARQRVEAAQIFIDALRQRQQTLLAVMGEIVHRQKTFFADGDESRLVPLLQKDIAEALGLDTSAVSRIVTSKYAQTDFGVFSLKYFFGKAFTNQEGQELSTREIKAALETLIAHEDKTQPLSDEALAAQLKTLGYGVARRTVTKYREDLNIPTARLRR